LHGELSYQDGTFPLTTRLKNCCRACHAWNWRGPREASANFGLATFFTYGISQLFGN